MINTPCGTTPIPIGTNNKSIPFNSAHERLRRQNIHLCNTRGPYEHGSSRYQCKATSGFAPVCESVGPNLNTEETCAGDECKICPGLVGPSDPESYNGYTYDRGYVPNCKFAKSYGEYPSDQYYTLIDPEDPDKGYHICDTNTSCWTPDCPQFKRNAKGFSQKPRSKRYMGVDGCRIPEEEDEGCTFPDEGWDFWGQGDPDAWGSG